MANSEAQNTPTSFHSAMLNKPANEKIEDILQDRELQSLIPKCGSNRQTSYGVLLQLLNRASLLIHDKWTEGQKLMIFVDAHNPSLVNLLHDFRTGEQDLGMVLDVTNGLTDKALTDKIPWHLASSTVEWHGERDSEDSTVEASANLDLVNRYRPDLVTMYGILASPGGYSIQFYCASGTIESLVYNWADIDPLLLYVYTLYVPRTDFPSRDPTISLSRCANILQSPAWDIRDGDEVYENCVVKSASDMTWVARVGDSPVMIKESYRNRGASFREGEIYDILHAKGPAPGFVKVKKEYDVLCDGRPIVVTIGHITRIKTRLIMYTHGQPLKKCATLIDFLKCMYDILKAHRWAVVERNILHRDISHGNILVQAEDFDDGQVFDDTEHRPIFVNEILNGELHAEPMARLADMDNAAELDPEKAVSPAFVAKKRKTKDVPLHRRTGTRRFIARSVAIGSVLVFDDKFCRMPELPSGVAEKYRTVHANDPYGLRILLDDGTTTHGGVYDGGQKYSENPELETRDFQHRPRHDAESVFWCMVVFLLLAVPLGSPEEDLDESYLYSAWERIGNHEFDWTNYYVRDSRLSLLRASKSAWETWLHPGLQHVGSLLQLLAAQVTPEWGLIQPPPHILHLHEAMQRIILTHIYVWIQEKKDVKFDTERTRDTTDPDSWSYRMTKMQQRQAATITPKPTANEKSADCDTSVLGKRLLRDDAKQEEESKAKRQQTTKDESVLERLISVLPTNF